MQTNFADMVGTTESLIAGHILAAAAHAEVVSELDSLTPALNEAAGPKTDASAFAGTGYIDICGWIQNESDQVSAASGGPISTFFGSCITQEPMAASGGPTSGFPCM
ncbi:MAG: hypothetical protein HOI34_15245 [Rhodospirillaceae bacterium]|jgi:hypothetical protein|nr:hypothetical protein [Rhodospirillaceae bacterium]MBT6205038.1 hypothetical protein [Rhodospirillaceae bacterium]MBT6512504.1 hypothetical protein [Rhodospirillaceae bacterium]MBT7611898.1 hypothetical protein [Rhodospirillaceae bacterium]